MPVRVTPAVPLCVTTSCMASSPGARAVPCPTTPVFTPKYAFFCLGSKIFCLGIARLSCSLQDCMKEGEGQQKGLEVNVTE